MWYEITHPFPNCNGVTVGVSESIKNCISHITGDVIIYPMLRLKINRVSKRTLVADNIPPNLQSTNTCASFFKDKLHFYPNSYPILPLLPFHVRLCSVNITLCIRPIYQLHPVESELFKMNPTSNNHVVILEQCVSISEASCYKAKCDS